ncbi:MAG: hypothetical protein HC880_18325 [Bacteroidia bacterium]|nr:hypothetical protein [Bacteroidia bacterium]
MFKHYFELIQGVAIYPIIGLTIFFVFFVGMIFWISGLSRSYVDSISRLPLENDNEPNHQGENVDYHA